MHFTVESALHKIIHNKNYLTIYYVLASLSQHTQAQPLLALDTVKNALAQCLDEYQETSWWWISSDRKTWISNLKGEINTQNSLDDICACLATYQVKAAAHDVKENKSRWLPMHWFGHSRFQTKLTEALNLISHLRANTAAPDEEIIKALAPQSLVDGPQPVTGLTQVIADIRQQAQQRITFFGAPKQLFKPPRGPSVTAAVDDNKTWATDLDFVASTASAVTPAGG